MTKAKIISKIFESSLKSSWWGLATYILFILILELSSKMILIYSLVSSDNRIRNKHTTLMQWPQHPSQLAFLYVGLQELMTQVRRHTPFCTSHACQSCT